MDDKNKIVVAAAFYVICVGEYEKKCRSQRRKRRWWTTSLEKSRSKYNATDMLIDLNREPSGKFDNFCRMSATDFEYLLNKIAPIIKEEDTNMRKSIPIQERVAVALRYLVTGEKFKDLKFLFKFSRQLVSNCVMEVCKALTEHLQNEIKMPKTIEEWLWIATEFEERWHFPHCIGALDGKHVVLQCPKKTGTEFFNYKGTFSIVLLAMVNANYEFTFVDIGCQGRISDGGVYCNLTLCTQLEKGKLMLPPDIPLPLRQKSMPYVIVADDTFGLITNMMKPYAGVYDKGSPERIYNGRLSRARRVVENVFGIMSSVFRVLRQPMLLEPDRASLITMTCVLLLSFYEGAEGAVRLIDSTHQQVHSIQKMKEDV